MIYRGRAFLISVAIAVATAAVQFGLFASPSSAAAAEAGRGSEPIAGVAGLPDGRAYEQVSPVEKDSNEAGTSENTPEYGIAGASGESLLYYRTGSFGETSNNLNFFGVTRRGGTTWSTSDALPAPLPPVKILNDTAAAILPSEDLSKLAFISPANWVAANPAGSRVDQAIGDIYLTDYGTGLISWLGEPTIASPDPAKEANQNPLFLNFAGASPDLDTVYFDYDGTLVPEDSPRTPILGSGRAQPWGFYEWREGRLTSAGILPLSSPFYAGEEDPYGAVPAATQEVAQGYNAEQVNNQVSTYASSGGAAAGSRAFFVSPNPTNVEPCEEAAEVAGTPTAYCTPQLYVRENGQKTVLVSRDMATGLPAPSGPMAVRKRVELHEGGNEKGTSPYVYAAPDGSRAFFESQDRLADDSSGDEPTGSGPWTYQFNLETETLTWLPNVLGPIVASSRDGASFLFQEDANEEEQTLDLWDQGTIARVTGLPTAEGLSGNELAVTPARATADGAVFVFQSDSPISGFNDGGGFSQIFRYQEASGELSCVSCPSGDTAPSGNAAITHDAGGESIAETILPSRGISADGSRVFFDTPDPLSSQDINQQDDVYEWERAGVGTCPSVDTTGCRYLISSGTSEQSSFLIDNNESGDDVFFTTTSGFSQEDTDAGYDVYDARAPHQPGEKVGVQSSPTSNTCDSGEGCQGQVVTLASAPLVSSLAGPSGNISPSHTTAKGTTTTLTRAQKLTKALALCRRKPRQRRKTCVNQAKRRYAVKRQRTHHAKKIKSRGE
jgi:3',5'-cyclic AMP phosphodiesterase CpdA